VSVALSIFNTKRIYNFFRKGEREREREKEGTKKRAKNKCRKCN